MSNDREIQITRLSYDISGNTEPTVSDIVLARMHVAQAENRALSAVVEIAQRQQGRTMSLIINAPKNAYFVCHSREMVNYAKRLCEYVGRLDLRCVSFTHNAKTLVNIGMIAFDHMCSNEHISNFRNLNGL